MRLARRCVVVSLLLAMGVCFADGIADAGERATRSACGARQLAVSMVDGPAGAGHGSSLILVRDRGRGTCRLRGYPEVRLLGAQGQVAAEATETPRGFTGGLPPGASIPTVALVSGHVASAILEGTDVPVDGATSCPSYPAYTITLPGTHDTVRIRHGDGSCSGLFVHPFVNGFNGSYPSGEVVGRVPACKTTVGSANTIGPQVQVEALSGSSVAGMVEVAASARTEQRFQMVLRPGRYRIASLHDPVSTHITVHAGETVDLGRYGTCFEVGATPTTTPPAG